MPLLAFDPAAHRYTLGDRVLPSVTQVLSAMTCDDASRFFTEASRERGTAVHLACQQIDEGQADGAAFSSSPYAGYIGAYWAFVSLVQPQWEGIEQRVVDELAGYAGTLDRTGTIQGQRVIVDIKTGTVPATVGLQLAAYRRCLPNPVAWARYSLLLHDDTTYRWTPHTDRHDEAVFLAALRLYRWRQEHS
jgi:hypothetical protein